MKKANPHGDPRGFFMSPHIDDAKEYAELAAHERSGIPALIEINRAKIAHLLDDVPHGIAGEKMIPAELFDKIPLDAFRIIPLR